MVGGAFCAGNKMVGGAYCAGNKMVGVLFVQEIKWWGVLFVKKWTSPPQNETKLNQTLLFILNFTYLGVRTYPTHPPPAYGHAISNAFKKFYR